MIKAILLGFVLFILFLILHVLIFHYFRIRRRFVVLKNLFFAIMPLYALCFFVFKGEALTIMQLKPEFSAPMFNFISEGLNFCVGLGLYIFLWLGYCQFYFIIDRSLSVRFMIEIANSPGKALSFDELGKIYTPDYIFRRRLEQMLDNGHLELKDEKYVNTTKGNLEAGIFRLLKNLLQLGPGG